MAASNQGARPSMDKTRGYIRIDDSTNIKLTFVSQKSGFVPNGFAVVFNGKIVIFAAYHAIP